MDIIFPPDLAVSFNYIKRSLWNTLTKRAATRKEYRASYWDGPLWEIEIKYDGLADEDMARLVGFQNLVQGALHNFYFQDRTNPVVGLALGTGDGVTTQFQLYRDWNGWYREFPQFPPLAAGYGEGGENYTAKGYGVPIWPTPYLYLDGVEVDEGYTIGATGLIAFATALVPGVVLTANFEFFYRVRFKEDPLGLEKYLPRYWQTSGNIVLVSDP